MEFKSTQLHSAPALQVHQLTVNYDKTLVLWDISFSIPPGVLVGIIGPNGAGKSTLIKASLGLVKPISGKIDFFGGPLKEMRQRVCYVPQRESVDWDFPISSHGPLWQTRAFSSASSSRLGCR
jgi:manganese/zinc/iron transport system ATP- binding protein